METNDKEFGRNDDYLTKVPIRFRPKRHSFCSVTRSHSSSLDKREIRAKVKDKDRELNRKTKSKVAV